MSNKQWNHGYNVGLQDGNKEATGMYEHGFQSGCRVAVMDFSEQFNILIMAMASSFLKHGSDRESWIVLRMMSEMNSIHMFNPDRAWHNTAKLENKEN